MAMEASRKASLLRLTVMFGFISKRSSIGYVLKGNNLIEVAPSISLINGWGVDMGQGTGTCRKNPTCTVGSVWQTPYPG